jgi:hypothetical protein
MHWLATRSGSHTRNQRRRPYKAEQNEVDRQPASDFGVTYHFLLFGTTICLSDAVRKTAQKCIRPTR